MAQDQDINWDDLRLFLVLARSGSARRASQVLKVSHTTITRRMIQLEKSFGTKLFHRNAEGFSLTERGTALIDSASEIENVLNVAQRQIQGLDTQLSGRIKLTAADEASTQFLMPDLAAFTQQYPEIDLDISLSYKLLDLSRREADIAIRFISKNNQPPPELVGRKLSDVYSSYYASESYLDTHNVWATDSNARWIGWNEYERYPDWVQDTPFSHLPVYGAINNLALQVQAAKANMGITVLPCFVGDPEPGLIRIPDTGRYLHGEIWMLSHPDLRETARYKVFRDYLMMIFKKKEHLLQGLS